MRSAARVVVLAFLLAGAGLAAIGSTLAQASSLPLGFQDETVFEGLEEPTTIRFAPDGHIFIAEKQGTILVYDSLADTEPTVFADLRTEVYDTGDRGILGLALDPNFTKNHYVYVLYTYDHLLGEEAPAPKWGEKNQIGDPCPKPPEADVDACPVSGRLVRLTAEGDHAVEEEVEEENVPAEDVLVEDWCQQFSSHSIGDLQFGPEGALFASGGDGASFTDPDYGQFGWPNKNQCGDPPGAVGEELTLPTTEGGSLRAQNTENLDGSVIRVDPETGEGLSDNPMAASLNANQRRIVAYGFRNPFRFAIDPISKEVYVGNVGWYTYEEIDRFSTTPSPAYNSGWPCYEGPGPTPTYSGLEINVCNALYEQPGSTAPPLFYYEHEAGVTPEDTCPTEFGSAIAGLDFYEGEAFPASYKGALFFSDPVRECIYVMFPGEDGRPDPATTIPFLTEGGIYPGIDIEEGPEGALFYVKLFNDEFDAGSGSIHRISYFSGNQPPVARLTASPESGEAPLEVEFDATESTDADGEQLKYEWDVENNGNFEEPTTEGTISEEYTDEENHTVAVRVRDEQGATSVARVTVYPNDTPPEPEIIKPEETSPESEESDLWHVGQPIEFEGAARDAEEENEEVPSTRLGWSSRITHCPFGPETCHRHPYQAFPAVASGTLIAPDHDYPSWVELTLTATDARGLAARKTIKLYPHPVELTIQSEPPGVILSAGELSEPAPYLLEAIEDSKVTLSAPATAQLGGTTYAWTGWSDGGARIHTVTAASSETYTAEYVAKPPAEEEAGPSPPPEEPRVIVPQTRLHKHPPKRTRSGKARFTFSSNERSAHFLCKLDKGKYRSCRSPRIYRRLKPGKHMFQVKAVDGGKTDQTPAVFRWRVL